VPPHKTVVLNVVGLTPALLTRTPTLARWAAIGRTARIKPSFPAVTCTAQADFLTGTYPERHGVVGNGWYSREDCEVRFWKQANSLVQAPKVWEAARARDSSCTVANLFWWFNMYSAVDYAVTPRPMYPADGRKIPDVHTTPGTLRGELQSTLGTFPLFEFWGPRTSIRCSEWIANASKIVDGKYNPTLTLIYLPHLDYNLQRFGVSSDRIGVDLAQVERVTLDLVTFYESRGSRVIVVSEYGLTDVSKPVHINRVLRRHGLITVRDELERDVLDPGASAAFAVADHQVAHIYLNDSGRLEEVRALVGGLDDVEVVLGASEKQEYHVGHPRAGDLIAIAKPDAWFTYYYWLDDDRAPDYARTVDIHRKPGYDPVELFLDPEMALPSVSVGWKLAKRAAGFRTLLDVIPLDATLVRGSHGRPTDWHDDGPLITSRSSGLVGSDRLRSVDVHDVILRHVFES
jgi:predicted AlkP superfamily pyrophosphatase or phosphodiesterase